LNAGPLCITGLIADVESMRSVREANRRESVHDVEPALQGRRTSHGDPPGLKPRLHNVIRLWSGPTLAEAAFFRPAELGFRSEGTMMPLSTIVKPLLLTAGVASAGMAASHFFLPSIYQWPRFMTTVPASILWGMYAINAFFSALLLLGSVATIRVALSPGRDKVVIWGMALFWAFNVAYQVIWPFPARAVRWWTLAFGVWMVASYALALWFWNDAPARSRR
jgi:hypothetical protein